MTKHHLHEDYMLLTFTPKEVQQVLSVPYTVFGAFLSLGQWHELVRDLCVVTSNKHTIYLLELVCSPLLDYYKIQFAEQYIQIQKNIGEYPK